MSESSDPAAHRRPHASPLAEPLMEFDLPAEIDRLRAKTRIPEHKTEGRISVHVLSGHIHLRAAGRTYSLRPGSLLALDHGMPHDVEALEESAFLLTIAWPGGR